MNINEHDKKEIKGCILLKDKVIMKEKKKFTADDLKWCINMASDFRHISNYILSLEIEKRDLQSRINRAIAYIEAGKTFPTEEARETAEYMQNMLLDILKGEDNENK